MFLFTTNSLTLNILSSPACNATSACLSISYFGEVNHEIDTVDHRNVGEENRVDEKILARYDVKERNAEGHMVMIEKG